MANINVNAVAGLTTIEDFINLVGPELGLDHDVSFTSIGIFTLDEASVIITGQNYEFTLEVTIEVDQDEDGNTTQELSGAFTISATQQSGKYTAEYGGQITIPTSDGTNIIFDLYYQAKTEAGKTTKLIVGQLSVQEGQNIGNVNLANLVSVISPGLAELFPEELVDGFNLNQNLLFVIKIPDPTVTPPVKKKMFFGIGFNSNIAFSDIPLISNQLPPDILSSQFTIELLVSLQSFDQKELKIINGFLQGLNSGIKIGPPSSSANELPRGISIAAYFNIGGYLRAWLVPLKRKVSSNPFSSRLAQTGEFRLVASPRTTTPEEDIPITIADNGAWLMVQKSFGTIHLEKVGLVYKRGEIHLTPKFTVQVSDFSLVLNGLSISTPLNDFKPTFNLDGFGLSYEKNSLKIAGAFLRKDKGGHEEYIGMVTLGMQTKGSGGKQKALSLSAVGAYAYYEEQPSLFLYLAVDYPLGGPPEIFVTGLAGGFGYNRGLIVPPLGEITEFPLVAQAIGGDVDLSGEPGDIINGQIESLSKYIPITLGAGFLAIGLKFTTYKLLDSFALLTLALSDNNFELNLIGISTLVVPPNFGTPQVDPVAVAQLALQARFSLEEGVILIRAELTPNSYILSQKCHLTGGYAAAFWFAGQHDGDFVVTLGGYHPRFNVPSHYPTVPRLGFNWQLDSSTSITGEGYFALCSHAVMAGGALSFRYRSGSVHVSFEVGADFLICWKPYYYDISARIKISGGIGCVSVSVRVDLHLWGPEFGGKAKIDLWIASATVKFGDQGSRDPQPIAWEEFKSSFLPEGTEICSIAASKGLVKQLRIEEGKEIWIINPTTLELVTDSFIPSKKAFTWDKDEEISTNTDFAINPMGIASDKLTTTHKITISKDGNDAKDKFSFEPVAKSAPTAIWGKPNLTSKGHLQLPEVNGKQFEENVFSGFRIVPAKLPTAGATNTIGVEHLLSDTVLIDDNYTWQFLQAFQANSEEEDARRTKIRTTISTNPQRDTLLQALGFNITEVNIDQAIADSFIFAPQVK